MEAAESLFKCLEQVADPRGSLLVQKGKQRVSWGEARSEVEG